jgi:NAD(P)-dependent dehydrogenase (short-subunit alcohol dehydrogenase family)
MESLAPEIEPFGIHTTVVNPGFFRTELLTTESTNYAPASIEDYAERNAAQREFWESMNGPTGRRPRQARPGAPDHHRPAAATVPVPRRRRRGLVCGGPGGS